MNGHQQIGPVGRVRASNLPHVASTAPVLKVARSRRKRGRQNSVRNWPLRRPDSAGQGWAACASGLGKTGRSVIQWGLTPRRPRSSIDGLSSKPLTAMRGSRRRRGLGILGRARARSPASDGRPAPAGDALDLLRLMMEEIDVIERKRAYKRDWKSDLGPH